MSLKLNSSGGGSVTLQEPATASALTLGLPAVNGTVITTADSGTVTPTMLSQKLTLETAKATTSGTSIDFTSIPSWVRRITIAFDGVSTNGTSSQLVRIGTSSGIETTGYTSSGSLLRNNLSSAAVSDTTGFVMYTASASYALGGVMTLINIASNKWVGSHSFGDTASGAVAFAGGGVKTLSGTLDRIRLTTVNGTDTFDNGSVNIMYEG